ncbi:Ubiquinol-cytochrome-c reductase complex assembly factor 1 [Portunus trituberculatus]|uniref:Ubiquinol-cytochrome-c reductase complex assembly factor 1 n=2 Tax=Portunus trituberculatus TaxID=210409 RepID=A0A5B7G888_PORTR|nr:Ubiquinol-cytochrome-c reductase complex assembly factor 1 [Portunus trituberculatus]
MMALNTRALRLTSRLWGASHSAHTTTTHPILRGTCLPLPTHQSLAPACVWTATTPATSTLHHHRHLRVADPLPRRSLTTSMLLSQEEPGRIKKFIKKIGWLDHSKGKLKRSGFQLYESACGNIMMTDFFQVFDLPDTFYSWFLVVELHVWMLMVRLMAEGEEGRYTRNAMLEAMWLDCETRSKKLGATSVSIRQQQIQTLGSSFQATIFAYDEGLMTNDCVLASALWRRLFSKECSDPERLECCINFIRRQMAVLDGMTRDDLLLETKVNWVPLLEDASGNVTFKNLRTFL